MITINCDVLRKNVVHQDKIYRIYELDIAKFLVLHRVLHFILYRNYETSI